MEKRGIRVNVYGEEIVFRPVEIGEAGRAKREAWSAYLQAEKEAAEKGDFLTEGQREAFITFAYQLLVQNYGESRAKEIAEELPIPIMATLINVAFLGREDVNFTGVGDQTPGSPEETPTILRTPSSGRKP